MTTRPAVPDDQVFLWEMLYQAIYVPAGMDPLPRDLIYEDPRLSRYAADFGTRQGDLGLIGELHGECIGAAWLRCFVAEDPGFGFVDTATPELSIALGEAHRGRGFGKKLMGDLLALARHEGYSRVSLSCDPQNQVAWRLYESLGFIVWQGHTMIHELGG